MGLGQKHRFILYTLGRYLQEANRKFKNKPLDVSVSKAVFIDVLKKAKVTDKSVRALYKNLEDLEKKKYIIYDQRHLWLSKKGVKEFHKIEKEASIYIRANKVISESPKARRVQATLRP